MAIKAHKTGPGTFKLGDSPGTEWGAQVTKITLTPSVDSEDDLHVLSGDVLPGDDTFTWELTATFFQDFDVDGVTDYLFDNRGQVLPFTFQPNNEHERAWTGSIKCRPMEVGGEVRKRNTSDVTFPLVGEPTKTTTTVVP